MTLQNQLNYIKSNISELTTKLCQYDPKDHASKLKPCIDIAINGNDRFVVTEMVLTHNHHVVEKKTFSYKAPNGSYEEWVGNCTKWAEMAVAAELEQANEDSKIVDLVSRVVKFEWILKSPTSDGNAKCSEMYKDVLTAIKSMKCEFTFDDYKLCIHRQIAWKNHILVGIEIDEDKQYKIIESPCMYVKNIDDLTCIRIARALAHSSEQDKNKSFPPLASSEQDSSEQDSSEQDVFDNVEIRRINNNFIFVSMKKKNVKISMIFYIKDIKFCMKTIHVVPKTGMLN